MGCKKPVTHLRLKAFTVQALLFSSAMSSESGPAPRAPPADPSDAATLKRLGELKSRTELPGDYIGTSLHHHSNVEILCRIRKVGQRRRRPCGSASLLPPFANSADHPSDAFPRLAAHSRLDCDEHGTPVKFTSRYSPGLPAALRRSSGNSSTRQRFRREHYPTGQRNVMLTRHGGQIESESPVSVSLGIVKRQRSPGLSAIVAYFGVFP
jgi:hypothetical protein